MEGESSSFFWHHQILKSIKEKFKKVHFILNKQCENRFMSLLMFFFLEVQKSNLFSLMGKLRIKFSELKINTFISHTFGWKCAGLMYQPGIRCRDFKFMLKLRLHFNSNYVYEHRSNWRIYYKANPQKITRQASLIIENYYAWISFKIFINNLIH